MSKLKPTKLEMMSNFAMGLYIGFGVSLFLFGVIYSAVKR